MDFYSRIYSKVSNFLLADPNNTNVTLTIQDRDMQLEVLRVLRYRKYWRAWGNIPSHVRGLASSQAINVNLHRAMIDRIVDFMLSDPFSPQSSFQGYSKIVSPVIEYLVDRANVHLTAQELHQVASVTGDGMIKVIWDSELQCPRFKVLDPEKCFLQYENTDKAKTNLISATIVWEGYYDWPDENGKPTRERKWVLHKEVWTKDKVIRGVEWNKSSEGNKQKEEDLDKSKIRSLLFGATSYRTQDEEEFMSQTISEEPNYLEFIPIVHFRNLINPFDSFGRSDLADFVQINVGLNEVLNQFVDSVHYHGNPITLIYGAKVGNLKKGANKIWSGLPKDSRVENLGGENDFPGIQTLINKLVGYGHIVTGVPEIASGLFENISNTTGVALQVQYMPLVNLIKRKQLSYGPAWAQCFNYALKILDAQLDLNLEANAKRYYSLVKEAIDEVPVPNPDFSSVPGNQPPSTPEKDEKTEYEEILENFRNNLLPRASVYDVKISWGDPLPKDKLLELNEIERLVDLGVESKRGAMLKLGIIDPDAKLEEILAERKREIADYGNQELEDSPPEQNNVQNGSDRTEMSQDREEEDSPESRSQKSDEQTESGNIMGTKQTPGRRSNRVRK